MASLSVRGLVPISAAIAGSDVAITVESMFSMNRAVATISGIRRSFFMEIRGRDGLRPEHGLYHPLAMQAIAEPSEAPKIPIGDTIAAAAAAADRFGTVLPRALQERLVDLGAGF